jgi:hypothetical protein
MAPSDIGLNVPMSKAAVGRNTGSCRNPIEDVMFVEDACQGALVEGTYANLNQDKPLAGIWDGSYSYNSQNIRLLAFEVKVLLFLPLVANNLVGRRGGPFCI